MTQAVYPGGNSTTGMGTGYWSYTWNNYIPQGWQCPVCKRVLSPNTSMCPCNGFNDRFTMTTLGTGSECIKKYEEILDTLKDKTNKNTKKRKNNANK